MGNTPETRVKLRRWLQARLTEGQQPKDEWQQVLEDTWDHLLSTRVDEWIDPDAAKALADQLADPRLIAELSRPIVAAVARVVIVELRQDEEPLSRYLPPEARHRLHQALARPGLVHPDYVRAVFRGEAAEAILNDALYRALRDFSTLLPRLMIKVSPLRRFGVIGGAGTLAEKLIREIESLIEPEIRSFLAEGTERLLTSAAEFAIAKLDEPASIEFRHALVDFVLSKSASFHLSTLSDPLFDDLGAIIEATAKHVGQMPEVRAVAQAWIDRAIASSTDKTLAEALHIDPARARPPLGALADASWPAFKTMVNSPQTSRWIDSLLEGLLEEQERLADDSGDPLQ